MVRQIKLEQIDDLMKEAVQELVQKTTLQWTTLVKKATPVGETGNLRNDWKTDIGKFRGTIINRMEYAEPVIYGTALPPSWGGRYRTRKQTIKGFPELQAKQLTVGYIPREIKRIIRGM